MYGKSNSMYRCMWNDVLIWKLLWNKYSFISFDQLYSYQPCHLEVWVRMAKYTFVKKKRTHAGKVNVVCIIVMVNMFRLVLCLKILMTCIQLIQLLYRYCDARHINWFNIYTSPRNIDILMPYVFALKNQIGCICCCYFSKSSHEHYFSRS